MEIDLLESLAAVDYKDEKLLSSVKEAAQKKFGDKHSYIRSLWVLREYKKRGGKVEYSGKRPSKEEVKKNVQKEVERLRSEASELDFSDFAREFLDEVEAREYSEAEKKTLNKPFRLPSGSSKKYGVYVKNDKGNVVLVRFGDSSMQNRRDDPERRKSFRARHKCDTNPGPKWKAKFWACSLWASDKSVTEILNASEASVEDFVELTQEQIFSLNPELSNVNLVEEDPTL